MEDQEEAKDEKKGDEKEGGSCRLTHSSFSVQAADGAIPKATNLALRLHRVNLGVLVNESKHLAVFLQRHTSIYNRRAPRQTPHPKTESALQGEPFLNQLQMHHATDAGKAEHWE